MTRLVKTDGGRRLAAMLRAVVLAVLCCCAVPSRAADAPRPLLAADEPVNWWFVFKFSAKSPFSGCHPQVDGQRPCPFGGEPLTRPSFGQQFAFASNRHAVLDRGMGCLGATLKDPVGATFDQVYNGRYFYVLWNDQFKGDPVVCGRSHECGKGWGHSKGMLAWNEDGEGFVMQVSTPSWPGSGTKRIERRVGNTLGCLSHNNLSASQHFFALKLTKPDLLKVLEALKRSNAPTKPTELQVVSNGGPPDVRALVEQLGKPPSRADQFPIFDQELSTGVRLIAKPSKLHVPPWQMVSALLGGAAERTATWWLKPWIYSTNRSTRVNCWSPEIGRNPGAVEIALTGQWENETIKLTATTNHAKIGTARVGDKRYVIFGDLNQQGSVSPPPDCDVSQNARGGLFFVLESRSLYDSVAELIDGTKAVLEPGPR